MSGADGATGQMSLTPHQTPERATGAPEPAADGDLARRLGPVHARQRIGIEREYEARIFRHGINFFHIENWYSLHRMIRALLRASGLSWAGRRNAARVRVNRNIVASARLPRAFDNFTLLHLSDLHVEMSGQAMRRTGELIGALEYDICVLTGDYRAMTAGPFAAALSGVTRLTSKIDRPIFAVLGNHDTVRMVPELERAGVRFLMNESVAIERGGARIHLAGVDDAHYFRVDNVEKAAALVPRGEFSVLLSHTPEIFRQAAHAGFDLMLSGHTHGGQICLPGGFAPKLNARVPRRIALGAWDHEMMQGYTSSGAGTSIVTARFFCPPEITLHRLKAC